MHRSGVDVRRARRWFWTLLVVAVLAMGVLYRALQSEAGPEAAVAVLLSSLVLLAATWQAARISSVLGGRTSRPRRGSSG